MKILSAIVFMTLFSLAVFAQEVPNGNAEASINLATVEGAKLIKGNWKYSDTRIIETDFKSSACRCISSFL